MALPAGGEALPVDGCDGLSAAEARLVAHVRRSLRLADLRRSKLPAAVLEMEGMSGDKTRHLYSNLCCLPGVRHLEVGCWKGSSLVAALYGNGGSVEQSVAIDDFSEFGGPKEEFLENVTRFLPGARLRTIDGDCFALDPLALLGSEAPPQPATDTEAAAGVEAGGQGIATACGSVSAGCACVCTGGRGGARAPFNVYVYDGAHSYEDQRRAVTHFWPALDVRGCACSCCQAAAAAAAAIAMPPAAAGGVGADAGGGCKTKCSCGPHGCGRGGGCVLLVDDWNWPQVREGTLDGLRDVGARVLFERQIRHTDDGSHSDLRTAVDEYWNGVGVFVVTERRRQGGRGAGEPVAGAG